MSTYTTGELADLCHVTVRTIQYYDRKELLKPAGKTEGNRRYYTEKQVQQMNKGSDNDR
ncbi:MerR family DNA-binding transcriptional regulator [Staphylococcus simiae]|uniref:MerR family regulatory protein n=1 Tax=Staphylococcus simiae CCM 7213 = CCUG 51256 TaxID=911238 RepID=G5JI03_9STAP|nr:MerR family regulatory protein [Staphylococcus simiae CCM 7213 = CCUG 51256]PNZ14273.1 MerR family DNA-binding transcriptional regulator [Staphylococcus simiae]SNV81831.1 MerR family transcriptional regulator [Staphylococcus simiae]